MTAILTLVIVALAVFNYNREVRYMEKVLGEKGGALIKSFEAGARAGRMSRFGTESRLQALIDATAELPNILYITLTDQSGKVIAHSNPEQIGEVFLTESQIKALSPTQNAQWKILEDNHIPNSFIVFKEFITLDSDRDQMRGYMMGNRMQNRTPDGVKRPRAHMGRMHTQQFQEGMTKPLIFIGLDIQPFVDAREEDIKIMASTSVVLLLVALGCMVSLVWVQAYQRSNKQLKDTQAFASEIVSNLPVGLVVVGPDGSITHFNKDAASLLGVEEKVVINRSVDEILPANIIKLSEDGASMETPITRELSLKAAGKIFPVNISVAPVVTDEGLHLGKIIILNDLTEIHRLQSEMRQREKMAAIGNLAAGIAHEVRNPLSSIKGFATYFAGLFDEGSENQKAAKVMISETERLNRVISELLEFTRPSDFKLEKADMNVVLDTVSRLLQQDAISKGIEIVTQVDQGLPQIQLDADRIVQALLNIGLNGIQAMESGGQLSINVRASGSSVLITVSDTGVGIPEENKANIFDPYFTTKNKGTGLGLAVVRKIVEGHGGSVDISSLEGKGTTFTISLI